MGCDIHPYIEEQDENGVWHPWIEQALREYIDESVRNGNALVLIGTSDDDEARSGFEAYMRAKPMSEIQKIVRGAERELPAEPDGDNEDHYFLWERVAPDELSNRSYHYFGRLAGVRHWDDETFRLWAPRGAPDDLSNRVRMSLEVWNGDAHTPSWQTFDELLNHPVMQEEFPHILEILRSCVRDTSKARMFYFFDN